ncbi:MAG: Mu-like prophage major head subunit gpT family protein [Deltaproteobacteria bacterium]|nr:Mu-like prophage major head subunit gpT family protein [Deltaproteobacteria bacterium]
MLVNKSNLTAVFINLKTTFNKAFDAAPSLWEKTTMKVPSGSGQNDYTWLSRFPKMRKWLGDKVLKALKAFKYTVVNDDWEATVEVDRNDIEDDNIGMYAPQAQDAGFSAKQLPDEIDADLKNNSFTNLCYDGQYFYDTDHEVAGSSVSNKGTAALSAATTAAAAASYGAARLAIMSFTDDEGRPLGLIPDLLEVPPALEATGRLLLENEKLTDESPNPYKGTATLLVNPRLTSSTAWFLHVTNRPLKPFIYQERKAPVFVQQTTEESDNVFMRKKFRFGAEARAAGGYGLWQMSYGSTGAG